jgi:adenylate cyclase
MGQEIERKFLVRGDGWRQGASGVFCRQGYLLSEIGRTIRIRIHGTQAFLTIKGKTEGIARLEYEYPIPVVDAHEMLERLCACPWVEKTRYIVWHAGMKWEIDEFLQENQGLIVAEVELKFEGQVVELPTWVGEEVSHDPRYLNVNLAKYPYSQWTEQQKT